MAVHVLDGGCAFEQAIMERGRGNPLFNFLFDLGSKEHSYYVWRLYSFAQGDTLQRWRTEPFIMITGSGRWISPALPPSRSPEHEKEPSTTASAGRGRRVELERSLTDPQRDEFEDMLRGLTLERSRIKEAMGFALDNADAAGEIVEVLTESLTLKETPIPTKVARVMLVSDILHNSSAPVKNASAYRTKFEATLPDIMESFNDLYQSITGRITAEALKERVLKVLQVWADWFLFSDAYVNGLRATFLRSGNSGVVPFHSICGDALAIENKNRPEDLSEGSKLNQDAALAMGKGAAMEELLGLPLLELERRCRQNGLSLCGGREMMVARLLNLEEAEKQRVHDRDEDTRYGQSHLSKYSRDDNRLGGNNAGRREVNLGLESPGLSKQNRHGEEALVASLTQTLAIPQPELKAFSGKKGKSDPVLTVSKWAREDDEDNVSRSLGLSYSSSGSEKDDGIEMVTEAEADTEVGALAHLDGTLNDEHRQKLRRLEVAVLEYRESLEERGYQNSEEIEKKVASHRRQLSTEFGLLDSTIGPDKHSTNRVRKEKLHDPSRKRHRSRSPQRKSSSVKEGDVKRGRESGSRGRDDQDRDRTKEGRRKGK